MTISIFSNDRSNGASANAVHVFNGKKSILCHFAGSDPELTVSLIEKKFSATNMTRRTHTQGDHVLAARF